MSNTHKKIPMQNIADRLQISKNAVSLALAGKPGVSEETRELVLALAKKLNYGNIGTSTESPSKNLLVFIPEYIRNDSHFYNDIYWSVDYRATQRGYNAVMTTITTAMQQQKTLPVICNEMGFAGYLLIGVLDVQYVRFLGEQNPHCLSVDHNYYDLACKSVVTDNLKGAYLLTQNVLSYNHREIGFVGSYTMTSSIYERWCGFQRALAESGVVSNPAYHIIEDSPLSTLFSNPQDLLARLQQMPALPTAFVCGGDRIAIATIHALKEMGRKVPEDLSVVGFDDIEMSSFIDPKLTTMQVKRKEMGRLAVDLLLKEIEGKHQAGCVQLEPDFIKRDSLSWARH